MERGGGEFVVEKREVNSTHAFGRVSTLRSNQRLGAMKLELEDAV